MKDAPFVEAPIAADSTDPASQAARKRLEAVLDDLNPAGGKVEPAGAKGDKAKGKGKLNKKKRKQAAAQT